MAQIQSAGTCFSDGVRTGPTFQDQVDRAAAPYMGFGPGMPYSTQYSYFFTPFPSANGSGAIPWDIAAQVTLTASSPNPATPLYLTLSNGNYPLSTQFVNQKTGRVGIQFDVPRCVAINYTTSPTASITFNLIGEDLYGIPMLEKIVIAANATLNSTIVGRKAFYRLYDVWCSGNSGTATTAVALRTTNKFGLPYRLYSGANIIALGGGAQCMNLRPSGAAPGIDAQAFPFTNAQIVAATKQGFFYNVELLQSVNPMTAAGYDTGGPTHTSKALDVRGTIDLDVGAPFTNPAWTSVAPFSICFTYVVLGFTNELSRIYEAKDRYNYNAQGTPDHDVIFPNALPILPNAYFNYPAGQYPAGAGKANVPEKLPINLTTAFGVPQFYTEARGDV